MPPFLSLELQIGRNTNPFHIGQKSLVISVFAQADTLEKLKTFCKVCHNKFPISLCEDILVRRTGRPPPQTLDWRDHVITSYPCNICPAIGVRFYGTPLSLESDY